MNESDEIVANYLVLCDQIITEAGSGKPSLIGIYSALMAEQLPTTANLTVGIGIRFQSPRPRELALRLMSPDGTMIFASPPLPFEWHAASAGLNHNGFASLHLSINLRAIPMREEGIYTACLYAEGRVLATYPISLSRAPVPPVADAR